MRKGVEETGNLFNTTEGLQGEQVGTKQSKTICHGVTVCIRPQFIGVNHNPQCDGFVG